MNDRKRGLAMVDDLMERVASTKNLEPYRGILRMLEGEVLPLAGAGSYKAAADVLDDCLEEWDRIAALRVAS